MPNSEYADTQWNQTTKHNEHPSILISEKLQKNPKSYSTSQTLQSLVSMMLNFTTTRKRLKKYSLSGKVSRRKLLSKKNMAARFIQQCPLDR